MTDLRDFEKDLRATLADVASSAAQPSGLADRLIAGAAQRRAPHRVQVWMGKRWVPPALVAATVAVVVVATVATVTAVQADRPAPPAHPTPAPSPTTSSSTPTAKATTPTASSNSDRDEASQGAPGGAHDQPDVGQQVREQHDERAAAGSVRTLDRQLGRDHG